MNTNPMEIEAEEVLIKLTGIFNHPFNHSLVNRLKRQEFKKELFTPENQFLRNTFYPEFRDLMFIGKEESSINIFSKTSTATITFQKGNNENHKEIDAKMGSIELFLSPNGLHFFSIQLHPVKKDLNSISDLLFCARNFDTKIITDEQQKSWVIWIEQNILDGIEISSKGPKTIKVDEYSGSKFKIFTVLDIPEDTYQIDSLKREQLLYDLGSVAPIGTAGGDSFYTPNEAYFESLLEDKIAVFKNYTMLPMFDTFTVLGQGILTSHNPASKQNMFLTWHQTYFRIYLFNLFIKYNLFRYNHEMSDDSVKVRDEFENFLNTYNLSHLSYNFLPNLIFHHHRKSLQIDEELEKFQDRINRISQSIVEEQQRRSNLLLGIVGAMTSIAGLQPILAYIEMGRRFLQLGYFLFYALVLVVIAVASILVLSYLFPEKKKKILRKWRSRND